MEQEISYVSVLGAQKVLAREGHRSRGLSYFTAVTVGESAFTRKSSLGDWSLSWVRIFLVEVVACGSSLRKIGGSYILVYVKVYPVAKY